MLKWLTEMTSPRGPPPRSPTSPQPPHEPTLHETFLITELVLAEVEQKVVEFEVEKEQSQSIERLNSKLPDYTWLVSAEMKPKKYLTVQEKYRLERACERLKAEEWAQVLDHFKARTKKAATREHILECFAVSAHEIISSRPKSVSVADVLRKYTRSASSVNAVSYTSSGETVHVGGSSSARTARNYGAYDHIV